jgi:hypothetical protein
MLMCMFILYGLYITEILNGILWPLHTVLHFIHFFLISFSSIYTFNFTFYIYIYLVVTIYIYSVLLYILADLSHIFLYVYFVSYC